MAQFGGISAPPQLSSRTSLSKICALSSRKRCVLARRTVILFWVRLLFVHFVQVGPEVSPVVFCMVWKTCTWGICTKISPGARRWCRFRHRNCWQGRTVRVVGAICKVKSWRRQFFFQNLWLVPTLKINKHSSGLVYLKLSLPIN